MNKLFTKWLVALSLILITIAAQSAIALEESNGVDITEIGCNLPAVGFESGLPAGWSSTSTSAVAWGNLAGCNSLAIPPMGNWTGGAGDAMCANSDAHDNVPYDAILISNAFTIPADTVNADLVYKTNYQDVISADGRDFFDLDITADNGGGWTNLLHWNEDHGSWGGLPGETVSIDLSAYAGQTVKVRWRYYDAAATAWDWYAQIDEPALSCDHALDFSDLAPALSSTAWHDNPEPRTLWLGPLVTDDANDLNGTDDLTDDGVILTTGWQSGGTANLRVNVSGNPGWLAGWVDWDNSGSFENPGERVLDQAVSTGDNNLSFPIPAEYVTGTTVKSRFRLYPSAPSTQAVNSGASPINGSSDGEVEDYTWSFTPTAVSLSQISGSATNSWLPLALGLAAILFLPLLLIFTRRKS